MNSLTRKVLSIGFVAAAGSALVLGSISPASASVSSRQKAAHPAVKALVAVAHAKVSTTKTEHYNFTVVSILEAAGTHCDIENTQKTRHGFALLGTNGTWTAYRGVFGGTTRTLATYPNLGAAVAAVEASINTSTD